MKYYYSGECKGGGMPCHHEGGNFEFGEELEFYINGKWYKGTSEGYEEWGHLEVKTTAGWILNDFLYARSLK